MNKINNKWALIFGMICFMASDVFCQILPPACTPSPGAFTQKPCVGVKDVTTMDTICAGDQYVWMVNNMTYTQPGTYTFATTNSNGCAYTEILVLVGNVEGCTDPTADNFDPDAVCDDGSCMTVQLGCICGETWDDLNFNGVQDPGEKYRAGIQVTLIDSQGTTISSSTTDAAGSYCFLGIPAGSYRVRFESLPFAFFTLKDAGNFDAIDSDVDQQLGLTDAIILASGECNSNTDAGYAIAD